MDKRKFLTLISLVMTVVALSWGVEQAQAVPVLTPGVDYTKPNFAYSPPLRKFINNLPGIGAANNIGQQIPLAVADTATFAGSDYYEIALVEYTERMHGDLPVAGTKLRGYVQEHNGVPVAVGPHYLGPLILATKEQAGAHQVYQQASHRRRGQSLPAGGHHHHGSGRGSQVRQWNRLRPGDAGVCQLHGEPRHPPSPRRSSSVDQRWHGPPVDHPRRGNNPLR